MPTVPRLLSRPFAIYTGLLLALVLLLPSLALDYQGDDHIHAVMAKGSVEPMQRHPARLFTLFPDSEEFRAQAYESACCRGMLTRSFGLPSSVRWRL